MRIVRARASEFITRIVKIEEDRIVRYPFGASINPGGGKLSVIETER